MSDEQNTKQEEGKKAEEQKDEQATLPQTLMATAGAPTQADIDTWKAQHGDVFVAALSETDLFVFRSITRPEWVQLQEFAADPKNGVTGLQHEELVCDQCVLWKSVAASWSEGKAGTPTSLQEMILANSNFVSLQQSIMLVARL